MEQKNRKKKKKKIIYNICLAVLIAVFFGCGIYLAKYFIGIKKSEDLADDLKTMIIDDTKKTEADDRDNDSSEEENKDSSDVSEEEVEYVDIDGVLVQKKFSKLYENNHDFIGWLNIKDTNIDYPVMQSMYDEEYYINRDFNKNYSGSGTLFIDTSSDVSKPSDSILIYGHNMQAGTMFHGLIKFEKEDYYKEHNEITFDTIYSDNKYIVIAAFRDEAHEAGYTGYKYYDFFDAKDEADFDTFVNYCKGKTPYEISETAEYGDKLLVLSTCAYHTKNGRFVVVAKRIE